jgi:hypothetical protein
MQDTSMVIKDKGELGDEWSGTWGEFLKNNEEGMDPKEVGYILGYLDNGIRYIGGGGAMATFTLEYVGEVVYQSKPRNLVNKHRIVQVGEDFQVEYPIVLASGEVESWDVVDDGVSCRGSFTSLEEARAYTEGLEIGLPLSIGPEINKSRETMQAFYKGLEYGIGL